MIRSASEVGELFKANGFELEMIDEGGGKTERAQDRPSSNAGPDTFRMRIVATKQ